MTFKESAVLILAAALALLLVTPAGAEEWKYDLEIYLLGAGLDGTTGSGPVEGKVDVSFGDILDNLEMGGMGTFRARKERWSVLGDLVFMGLGASGELVDVDVDQLVLELAGAYNVGERVAVLFGGRYVDIESQLDFRGPLAGLNVRGGENWLDPFVGLGVEAPMGERWTFFGRGDIGGFGVGSDLSYQVKLNFAFRPGERYSVILGYRLLDIDYDDGTGTDRFLYDVLTSGPNAGIIFHF